MLMTARQWVFGERRVMFVRALQSRKALEAMDVTDDGMVIVVSD